MKENEVPQDKEDYKGKSQIHKLMYATKEDGSYTQVNSEGWEVENMATRQAWEAVLEELQEIEARVRKGELSPIAYFMHKHLMELPILARHMGKWQWQIKRHFKPAVFRKLDQDTLNRYARVFNIPVDTLVRFGQ